MEVTIDQAKADLSVLIDQALAGEDIVIAKPGGKLVRLVRIDQERPELGSARGAFRLDESWDAPLSDEEIEDVFGR